MKKIVGLKIRTNNSKTESIMELWNKFYSGGHVEKLGLKEKNIYAVYHNYESDENGGYDLLVGGESDISTDTYQSVEIKDNTYKIYTTSGEMPQKVIDAWGNIWKDSNNRIYATDYELYTPDKDSSNPNVTIYIGIQ